MRRWKYAASLLMRADCTYTDASVAVDPHHGRVVNSCRAESSDERCPQNGPVTLQSHREVYN